MALKQINWGYQFQRNGRGPLDPDSTFATYDDMINSALIYNGAIVSVTSDTNDNRNGIYLVRGNDDSGTYTFTKGGTGNGQVGLPILLGDSASVISVDYQDSDNTYKVSLSGNSFANLDIVGWGMNDSLTMGTYSKIEYSLGDAIYIKKGNKIPIPGDVLYHVGNEITPERQIFGALFLRDGVPMQGVFVNSSTSSINKNLHSGIRKDSAGNPQLYSENALIKGIFLDTKNRNISEEIDKTNSTLTTSIADLRDEFSSNNLINNPFFLESMKGWTTKNDAVFFTALGGKWLYNKNLNLTQDGIYSAKRKGAYIDTFDNKVCLSIQEGFVEQKAENLKTIVSDNPIDYPVWVNLNFVCWVIQSGKLSVKLGNATTEFNLENTSGWIQIKTVLPWNGEDGLELSFLNGTKIYAELKIRGIILEIDGTETLKRKYAELFAYSQTLVQMAKERESEVQEEVQEQL